MATAAQMMDLRTRKPFVQEDKTLPKPEEASDEEAEMEQEASVIDMKEKPSPPRVRSAAESIFWVVASCCILYYGDGKRNFIEACFKSPFVIERPFNIACLCTAINSVIIFYLGVVVRLVLRDPRHFDNAAPGAVSAVTLLGVMAYILFSVSLWPVFGAWILPMLWCFFMGMVVVGSLMPTHKEPNPKYLVRRED